MAIEWRDACKADRVQIRNFCCTFPDARPADQRSGKYPAAERYWERQAQSIVRTEVKPPAHGQKLIIVGDDDGEIVAVGAAEPDSSPADWFLLVVAVEVSRRQRGLFLADGLMDALKGEMARRADAFGARVVDIYGNVHARNSASKRMLERHGFTLIGLDDDYERWASVDEIEY